MTGPDNSGVTTGIHQETFAHRAGKTHFSGYRIQSGSIWQARGKHTNLLASSGLTYTIDHILASIINFAKQAIEPYNGQATTPPDPSFVLQLPDEAVTGSNLYAIQKTFDGPFQFDVFFESASANQKLTCKPAYSTFEYRAQLTRSIQSCYFGQRDCGDNKVFR